MLMEGLILCGRVVVVVGLKGTKQLRLYSAQTLSKISEYEQQQNLGDPMLGAVVKIYHVEMARSSAKICLQILMGKSQFESSKLLENEHETLG